MKAAAVLIREAMAAVDDGSVVAQTHGSSEVATTRCHNGITRMS
jgi:hypothetical protein